MDDVTINKLLSSNTYTKHWFAGVFASNTLPENPKDDQFYVVNLDRDTGAGTHWIVIHLCRSQRNEYFDSYGWKPSDDKFVRFMQDSYIYSTVQLQSQNTTACGQWCILFVWYRCKGKSMDEFL